MNEIQKAAARDAFEDSLRRAGQADPFFRHAEHRWHTAKRHVAKGHEEERARLQRKGMGYGFSAGSTVGGLLALGKGIGPVAVASLAGAGLGALAGHRLGAWEAERRMVAGIECVVPRTSTRAGEQALAAHVSPRFRR